MSDILLQDGAKGDQNAAIASPSAGSALLANSGGDRGMPDLLHTAAEEKLSGFYNTHSVVKGTFPWSTSDPVGKILFMFPNHPSECNWLVDYVQKLFVGWVGHMQFEWRILGTAFMGGSLACILVPPTYTRAQVAAMTREDMSIFDYIEVDPKNLDTMKFKMKDFRPEHFHYEPYSDDNPRSFGGWIVCMVWGQLNISPSTEGASLDVLVRTNGNYEFRQPRPLITGGISLDNNFPNFGTTRLSQQMGCDDMIISAPVAMTTISWNIPTVSNGLMYGLHPYNAQKTDGSQHLIPYTTSLLPATWVASEKAAYVDQWKLTREAGYVPKSVYKVNGISALDNGSWTINGGIDDATYMPALNITSNATFGANTANADNMNHLQIGYQNEAYKAPYLSQSPLRVNLRILELADSEYTPNGNNLGSCATGTGTVPTAYFPIAKLPPARVTEQNKVPSFEKMVIFSGNGFATFSLQTEQFKNDIRNFQWPSGTSAIFSVNTEGGPPIAFVRISSVGIMTTTSTFSTTDDVHFRFIQWLPDNSSMPVNPEITQQRNQLASQAKEIARMKAQISLMMQSTKKVPA